jgi:hypothetical protein
MSGVYYRYPGAQPFSTKEANIFFGRGDDAERLERRVLSSPLLVLYAKSGLGKSSLLNAGLTPRVEKNGRLKTHHVRFGAYQANMGKSPLSSAQEQLSASSSLLDQLHQEEVPSLWYLIKAQTLASTDHDGALIILDQFEELFTYPKEEIAAFATQLAELLYRTIPDRFREGLETTVDQISEEDLRRLHNPSTIRVVMAIRSDRLALLDRLKPYLPNILDNTYELLPLQTEQAEDAILNPAYEKNGFKSPVFDYEDEAVEHLIQFLSQGESQFIESYQLQILCEYVERKLVIEDGKTLIRKSDLSHPQQILEDYYWSKIDAIADPADRLAARKLIEEGLIFEEEERRLNLYEGQIEKSYGVDENLLRELVDSRLLRAEPSLRGGYTYELSHDTLVAPVLKAKSQRLAKEKAEREAQEKAEREAELNEERKKRAQARRVATFMGALALLAVVALVIASLQTIKMREALKETEAARKIAELARAEAAQRQEIAELALYERKQVEIQKVLQDVQVLEEAGQYTIAHSMIAQALETIDSTDEKLKNNLSRLEKLKSPN